MADLIQLEPVFVERVWGSHDLSPLYPAQERRIGEVWFQTDPPLPLLIKFIFTTAPLSVQVHPNDAQARAAGLENGKTEMWHILRADPGASIALGFGREHGLDEVKAACLDGSVERLLHYEYPQAGSTYFTRANTVHALGAGLTVVEIQQHSDTTYRLYDYGRPRELHLDAGLAVSDLRPWQAPATPPAADSFWTPLAACEYFVTEEGTASAPVETCSSPRSFSLFITLSGAGEIGGHAVEPGQVWLAGPCQEVTLQPRGQMRLLRVSPTL